MLKNTAFHDNLYQIAKIISITTEGLSLELSENMFLNKTVADLFHIGYAAVVVCRSAESFPFARISSNYAESLFVRNGLLIAPKSICR